MSSNANRSHTNPSHITFLTDQAKTDHQEAVANAMGSLQTSGSDQTLSSIQQVGGYAWNGTNWERTQVDGAGSLNVNIVSGGSGGGDASASNQLTMISSLSTIEGDTTSLDAKITACNTGAVVVSSSVLPTGGSTATLQTSGNASLTSIDGKITACDTGAVVVSSSALPSGASTSANQSTANGLLSSIDGNITACDTGAVVVSSSALPTGGATSALQTSGNASLTAIQTNTDELNNTIYQYGDSVGLTSKGQLAFGRDDSLNAIPLHTNSVGDLEVDIASITLSGQALMASSFPVVLSSDQSTLDVKQKASENLGSANNLANNITINTGANSSSVDVSNMRESNVIYEDTSTTSFDGLDIDISVDGGTTYHESFSSLYPQQNTAGTKRVATYMNLNLAGITHIRLTNTSTTDNYANVYASIVGCP